MILWGPSLHMLLIYQLMSPLATQLCSEPFYFCTQSRHPLQIFPIEVIRVFASRWVLSAPRRRYKSLKISVFFTLSCSIHNHANAGSFSHFLAYTLIFKNFSSQSRQKPLCWLLRKILPSSGEPHRLHYLPTVQRGARLSSCHHSPILPWLLCRSNINTTFTHFHVWSKFRRSMKEISLL